MSRTSLKKNPDYFTYYSDVVDLDDWDDFGYRDGVNAKVNMVTSVDTMSDHHSYEDLCVNYGSCKRQYEVNDNTNLVNYEEDLVNKGKKRNASHKLIRHFETMIEVVIGDIDE